MKQATRPVSYTHLDVYKRQVVGSIVYTALPASVAPVHKVGARHEAALICKVLHPFPFARLPSPVPPISRRGAVAWMMDEYFGLTRVGWVREYILDVKAVSYTHLDVYKRQVR